MYLYCLLLLVLTTATDNQHGIVLVKLHSAPRDLSLACFDQDTITTDESSHTLIVSTIFHQHYAMKATLPDVAQYIDRH